MASTPLRHRRTQEYEETHQGLSLLLATPVHIRMFCLPMGVQHLHGGGPSVPRDVLCCQPCWQESARLEVPMQCNPTQHELLQWEVQTALMFCQGPVADLVMIVTSSG